MNLKHDELAEELARAIGLMPFLNVPLGSVFLADWGTGPSRADVVGIKPSYTQFCISIYEVKVSRADFLSDIRSDKWRGYLPHCNRFYFAVDAGVAKKDEIPEPAGLMVHGDKGWYTSKGAKPQKHEIPVETLKALLFSKTRIPARIARQKEINDFLNHRRYYSDMSKNLRKLFGSKITETITFRENFEQTKRLLDCKIDDLQEIDEIIQQLGQLILPECKHISLWKLQDRVTELMEQAQKVKESAERGA